MCADQRRGSQVSLVAAAALRSSKNRLNSSKMFKMAPGHSNYSTLGVLSVHMNDDAARAHVTCTTTTPSLLPSYATASGRGSVGAEIPHLARFLEAKFKLTSWEIVVVHFDAYSVFDESLFLLAFADSLPQQVQGNTDIQALKNGTGKR